MAKEINAKKKENALLNEELTRWKVKGVQTGMAPTPIKDQQSNFKKKQKPAKTTMGIIPEDNVIEEESKVEENPKQSVEQKKSRKRRESLCLDASNNENISPG